MLILAISVHFARLLLQSCINTVLINLRSFHVSSLQQKFIYHLSTYLTIKKKKKKKTLSPFCVNVQKKTKNSFY